MVTGIESSGINIGSITAFCSVDPRTSTRSYATTAYLLPNIHRTNLHVLVEAQVVKVRDYRTILPRGS